jgi:replicative DNA helicase
MIKLFARKKAVPAPALTEPELGTPTGLSTLDEAIAGGLKAGQLTILGGPTGSGKSALASQIALAAGQWAADHDRGGVLFFSYEMNAPELTTRLLRQATPEVRDGYRPPSGWSERDKPLVEASTARIRALPIRIEDEAAPSVSAIADTIRRSFGQTRRAPCLVIVDHLGLLGAPGARSDAEALHSVTRDLKNVARATGVPILALAQMNHQVDSDKRADHRPQLSDLRGSAAVEHDADLVLLLYAPHLYFRDREEAKRLTSQGAPVFLMVAKSRSGPISDVKLEWVGPHLTFRQPAFAPGE